MRPVEEKAKQEREPVEVGNAAGTVSAFPAPLKLRSWRGLEPVSMRLRSLEKRLLTGCELRALVKKERRSEAASKMRLLTGSSYHGSSGRGFFRNLCNLKGSTHFVKSDRLSRRHARERDSSYRRTQERSRGWMSGPNTVRITCESTAPSVGFACYTDATAISAQNTTLTKGGSRRLGFVLRQDLNVLGLQHSFLVPFPAEPSASGPQHRPYNARMSREHGRRAACEAEGPEGTGATFARRVDSKEKTSQKA